MPRRSHALCTFFLICSLPVFSQGAVMFRGDAQHSGHYAGAGVPKLTGVKWKFATGGKVVSSPAVVNGVVYIGSYDRNLYALEAATGAVKWKFETGSRVSSSPAVTGGVAYFGSYDGVFYAVDTATGKEKWHYATNFERRFAKKRLHGGEPRAEVMPDPFDFYLSSPAVVENVVYFGSGDGFIYALDTANGTRKWRFETGDVVHASPAVADGVVYVGGFDANFYALDATTGRMKWRFSTGTDPQIHNQEGIQSSAAIADGVVYFGCRDSKLYAVDAKTGEQRWQYSNKGSWVIGTPIVHEGKVYFTTSDSGMFRILDAKTGGLQAERSLRWPMFSSPAIAGNTLYLGSNEGKFFAFDLGKQDLAWTFQTEASKQNGPGLTQADGKPDYAKMFTDFFYDNMVIGVEKSLSVGTILSSPAIDGDTVYFGSADGNVYALH